MPKMTTCTLCQKPMEASRNTKPGYTPAHNACRKNSKAIATHGETGYRYGCRCATCKAGQATRMRAYAQSVRDEHGVNPATLRRRQFKVVNGYWPQRTGSDWIDPKVRRSLYERDNWTCHLCSEPIDRDAHWNDDYAPSLDHLIPRSAMLVPDHSADNLLTAHRLCNSLRGDAIDGRLQPSPHQLHQAQQAEGQGAKGRDALLAV